MWNKISIFIVLVFREKLKAKEVTAFQRWQKKAKIAHKEKNINGRKNNFGAL